MSYGLDSQLSITFQNSWGTALTNSRYGIPFTGEGFAVAKETIMAENMTGRYDEGQMYEGINTNEGSIDCEVNPIALGAMLKAMFGSPTTASSGTGMKNHVFKPPTTDFDIYAAKVPCTIYKNLADGGSAHLYYDMVANKFSLSISNGELLKANVEFIGGKYSQIGSMSVANPSNLGFTWDVASVTFGGSAQLGIRDLNIAIEEGLEVKHFVAAGVKTPGRIKRSGSRSVTIGGTIVFDNQNEYQQFLSQSERELVLFLQGPTLIQSGYYDMLKIQIPGMRYSEFKPVAGGPEEVEVGFSAKGVYNVNSATAIQITLTNTQPSY